MPRVSKLNVWLKCFLDESCLDTFLNKTESARKARYKTTNYDSLRQIGCQNFTKLNVKITKWLDENGLSDNALKLKLLSLMEAHESKFVKIKGAVSADDLPKGSKIITMSGTVVENDQGVLFSEGETLLSVDVEAIETQRKTLDMAMKSKGMNAPIKLQVGADPDNPPVWELEVTHVNTTSKT